MSWRTVIIEGRCKLDYRIESTERSLLSMEKRVVVDMDLCEIY